MNDTPINDRDFRSAVARLREGVAQDPASSPLVIDGVIQRFEFTFEQAWKLLKSMLRHEGFDCQSPRGCIKEAFQQGMIRDGDGWIAMLEDRNRTAHLYDEKDALFIYRTILSRYVALFGELETRAPR
jgi:nucleotidyltransferase substrate binding protein (TIGR01987 family)